MREKNGDNQENNIAPGRGKGRTKEIPVEAERQGFNFPPIQKQNNHVTRQVSTGETCPGIPDATGKLITSKVIINL